MFVDDVAAACGRAARLGGWIRDEPGDRPLRVREAVVADPEGRRWVLTNHVRDTDPAHWYGTGQPTGTAVPSSADNCRSDSGLTQ